MSYPGPHRPSQRPGPGFWLAVVGLPLLLVAGCLAMVTNIAKNTASDRDTLDLPTQPGITAPATTPPATTPPETAAIAPPADPTAPEQVVTSAAPTTQVPVTTAPPVQATTPPPAKKELPNVVGMNLQEAQDTMQAAGFLLLRDKDDTGKDRFQVFDRNWVVTRQTPEAGRQVNVASWVTLFAKKKTD